jgi:hypothetical protein
MPKRESPMQSEMLRGTLDRRLFAPTLANESAVRGIVVYGTLDEPPSPYPRQSDRFFSEIAGLTWPARGQRYRRACWPFAGNPYLPQTTVPGVMTPQCWRDGWA